MPTLRLAADGKRLVEWAHPLKKKGAPGAGRRLPVSGLSFPDQPIPSVGAGVARPGDLFYEAEQRELRERAERMAQLKARREGRLF